MKAQTFGWLVFLALIKSFSLKEILFTLGGTERVKRATEGSCVDLKYKVKSSKFDVENGHWFWMKDANYSYKNQKYQGTVVYSSRHGSDDVSEDFRDRVTYTGSPPETWANSVERSQEPLCSISICGLKKSDNGGYSLRFLHNSDQAMRWFTNPWFQLTVEDNACPITFDAPQVRKENTRITLTCSTSTSCESAPEIYPLPSPSKSLTSEDNATNRKSITHTFTVRWTDDGKMFSCQKRGNTDQHLMRNVTVGVEYAPKYVRAWPSRSPVNEGESVTLICLAKGNPEPTFTWYKGDQVEFSGANETIASIREADRGSYQCVAKNNMSESRSNIIDVEVTYAPEVEVLISPESGRRLEDVEEGDEVTFTCNVKRSNPPARSIVWFKDETRFGDTWDEWSHKRVFRVQPVHSGNYACKAANSVGSRKSQVRRLQVKYKPKNTRISGKEMYNNRVTVNRRLVMTCETDAYPAPWFSWYKQTDASQKMHVGDQKDLTFEVVQRAHEGCYTCNASNNIDAGDFSKPRCIQIQYPPTDVELSLRSEVTEGQLVTISCTAESFPPSDFTLTRSSTRGAAGWPVTPRTHGRNSVSYNFTAASTDTDFYTCSADNRIGKKESSARRLTVKYAPKEVKVNAWPDLVVKEDDSFKLDCTATAHPPVTSVTWTRTTDEDHEAVLRTAPYLQVEAAGPADGGWYRCEATNEVGTGRSQQVHVKVKYGPKHAEILRREKQQLPDGTSSVLLSCITHCYPPVTQYLWYKRTRDRAEDVEVSDGQNITVSSGEPGEYYCRVQNEMSHRTSAPVTVFDRKMMRTLTLFIILCLALFIAFLIFFVYRRRRNKSNRGRTANTRPSCGFMGVRNRSRRGNLMNEAASAEPFRSRDDLLPNQLHPDSTPTTSNITSVYCTVNLPKGNQIHSARPVEEDSVNYASLHFGNKQKKPEEGETVYAEVSKPHPNTPRKTQRGNREDYENAVCAAQPSHSDDTSEDDVEVSYSQVTFKLKGGNQPAQRDSNTNEEETQYSEVKI